MELTDEQLKQVQEWAEALFTPKDVALIVGLDPDAFAQEIKTKKGKPFEQYKRGQLMAIGKLRKAIMDLAINGSGPAQQLALKMLEDLKIDEQFET